MGRRRQAGVAAVELTLVLPVLFLLLFGIIQVSWLMLEYAMLTNAAAAGAEVFSTERGFTTPYTDTVTQVHNSAATLDLNNMSITITVGGQACNSNATCQTALALPANRGRQVSVQVSYTFVPLIADGFISQLMPTNITSTLKVRAQ